MKKQYQILLGTCFLWMVTTQLGAQSGCAISSTNNLHSTGCVYGDEIDYFELDGVGNASGCANNFYDYFSTPVWTLQIGQTYTWTADVGNFNYPQGFAIWIDLNNDGFFTSNEQVANGGNPALTHNGSLMVPYSASPGGAHRMRLRCDYYNVIGNTNQTACEGFNSVNWTFDYGETEDYDVVLLPPPPCSGVPAANTVVGPTVSICPNSAADIGLSTTYTTGGMTYLWQTSSTSSVGPWTNLTSTWTTHNTGPTNQPAWYQVVVGCSNSGQSVTATPYYLQVQGITVDSVPYFEGFEGITDNDDLPNCSWSATNLGSEAFTYTYTTWDNRMPRTGNNYASFYYSPGGTNSFFTNEIFMHSGVTYSVSVWYTTNIYGDDNWEDLSILVGTSPGGGQVVASTPAAAISSNYKLLTYTFTVPSTANYFVEVQATSNTNAYAPYLSWDDLAITIPCQLNPVAVNLSTPTSTVCEGDAVVLTASGADQYSWSNNAGSAPTNSFEASNSGFVTVTGTNTITGCTAQASVYLTVNKTPFVAVVADHNAVCEGDPVNLTAVGEAIMYSWSNSSIGTNITVNPTSSNKTFSVIGSSPNGCTASAAITLTVNPLPTVQANAGHSPVCIGDQLIMNGSGATSYQWQSASNFIVANPAIVIVTGEISYTVTGTDDKGCSNTAVLSVIPETCLGVEEGGTFAGLSIYPNPGTGVYTVDLGNTSHAVIEVVDIVGRKVYSAAATETVNKVDISALAAGLYYFNVKTAEDVQVTRVIKN